MTEIKPVFYIDATTLRCRTMDDISDESVLYYRRGDKVHETDIALYPESAIEALQKENAELKRNHKFTCENLANTVPFIEEIEQKNAAQAKRIAEFEEDLQFVERWANHHGTKPNVTAQEALSCIQHYPSIAAITKSYKDGVIPNTRNPYAEIESLRKQLEELTNAATFASSALAHSSNNDPLYNKAYLDLRAVLFPELKVISAASKNGE